MSIFSLNSIFQCNLYEKMILPLILTCLPSVSSESMSSQTDQEGGFELSLRHYVHYAYSLHNQQISWSAT